MGLTGDELRDVLARAQEIESGLRDGTDHEAEVAAVIEAAEEVGLSRRAVERALAERLYLPGALPAAGSLTWARAADGKTYVAEVLSTSDGDTHLRFLRGGEAHLPIHEIRPFNLTPGERVVCEWPGYGMAWTSAVVGYDRATRRIELSDRMGSRRTFPNSEIWLAPPKSAAGSRWRRSATFVASAAAGAVAGFLAALSM